MPKYIVVIGESKNHHSALIKAYIEKVQGDRYTAWSHAALLSASSQLIVQGTNYFTSNAFEVVEVDCANLNVVGDITAWKDSVAVIYAIPHRGENEPEAEFTTRVQQECLRLKEHDHSLPHVKKYLVLVEENLPLNKRHPEMLNELKIFALLHNLKIFEVQTSTEHSLQVLFTRIHNETKTAPNILSRIVGAILCAVLSGLTFAILANPLARFFAEWHNSRWDTDKHAAKSTIRIVFSPLISLIYDIKMIWRFIEFGWQGGFFEGLTSPLSIIPEFDEYDIDDIEDEAETAFNIAPRNIIASLIIIGLITATVLIAAGVAGPLVVAGLGLSALVIQSTTLITGAVGLTGVSAAAAAAISGTVVGVGSAILYGLGYGFYKALNNYLYPRRKSRFKRNDRSLEITDEANDEPNILSRALGALLSAVLGGLTTVILLNPLAHFYLAWQKSKWNSLGNIGLSILKVIGFPFLFIGINTPRIVNITKAGWDQGFVAGVTSFFTVSESLPESSYFRNIAVSLVVIVLGTTAVLLTAGVLGSVIVGGVGLTALAVQATVAIAGAVGLTGLGTAALAAIAGTAVGLASSLIYGVVYGTAKLVNYCCDAGQMVGETKSEADTAVGIYYTPSDQSKRESRPLRIVPASGTVVYEDPKDIGQGYSLLHQRQAFNGSLPPPAAGQFSPRSSFSPYKF
jgi:hypothetical protein